LDYKDKKIKPVWESSNLDAPNCDFKFSDADNDGKLELVVIEGSYETSGPPDFLCEGKYVAIWKWNGWGFSNEWRGEKENPEF